MEWYNEHMLHGKYKIYLDGKLVAEKENSITKAGRAIILKALMGLVPTVGGSIQLGVGNTANTKDVGADFINEDRLQFSIGSSPVQLSFLDNAGEFDAMVFKTSLGSLLSEKYSIYELGLFPEQINNTTKVNFPFIEGASGDSWLNGTTFLVSNNALSTSAYIDSSVTSYPFRIGNTALFVKSGETVLTNKVFNLTNPGSEDYISLALAKLTGDHPVVTIKFYTSETSYYTMTTTLSGSETYKIVDIKLSDATVIGSPTWTSINKTTINVTSANVVVDAVRFNDNNNYNTVSGMVSRTVLDTPIQKASGQAMDIEYYLTLGFNKTVV